jgi:hypothetical protein
MKRLYESSTNIGEPVETEKGQVKENEELDIETTENEAGNQHSYVSYDIDNNKFDSYLGHSKMKGDSVEEFEDDINEYEIDEFIKDLTIWTIPLSDFSSK